MDLILADTITVDQLMIDDLIKINNEIVQVTFIKSDATGDNYDLEFKTEDNEIETISFFYTDLISIYIYVQ